MRRAAIILAVLLLALPAAAAGKPKKPKPEPPPPPPPNIVMVVTDDQTLAQYNHPGVMPKTRKLLGKTGTTFTDAIVSTPLCCPSRATMLTGQYGHNNGVLRNNYDDMRAKDNTLPVWLREAGYTTMHVGKYMNQYAEAVEPDTRVAPGWDEWHSAITPHYYNYELMVNGAVEPHGAAPEDYLGRVLTERSVSLIQTYAPEEEPFYLQLDHFAPHIGVGEDESDTADGSVAQDTGRCAESAVPDPVDYDSFAFDPLPTPPSFDEEDVSDKPSFIQALPRIDEETRARLQDRHSCALASLRSVDRSIAAVYNAVKAAGELERTVFIFVSDNGFFGGEHRIPVSKQNPYEETLRVPLVISAPKDVLGKKPPRRVTLPVSNVDLAPTILGFAGAEPCSRRRGCRKLDGRSMLPLLTRRGTWPEDRAIVVELNRGKTQVTADGRACSYTGIRTPSAMFVEHAAAVDPATGDCTPFVTPEHELYDLVNDPFELQSLVGPALVPGSPESLLFNEMAARSLALRDCAGIEGRDRRPAGRTWCE